MEWKDRVKSFGAGRARRRTVVALGGLVAALALPAIFVASASAAPPETPEAKPATSVTAHSATLNGVLNPGAAGEPGGYAFRYRPSGSECEGSEEHETPEAAAAGAEAEAVGATISNLLPATTYAYCLVAYNGSFEQAVSAPLTFTTAPAPPVIDTQQATNVGLTSAQLGAQINPGGLSSHYHVEYVTEAQFNATEWTEANQVPFTDAQLPGASSDIAAGVELSGLQPSTSYRFRFVVSNALGTVRGPAVSVSTGTTSSGTLLPDGRVFERVSGESSADEAYVPNTEAFVFPDPRTEYPFIAATGGEALTYVGAVTGQVGGNGLSGTGLGNQYLARRNSLTGWETTNLTPQAAGPGEGEHGTAYEYFSPDLSLGVLASGVAPSFARAANPQGPTECQGLYSRSVDGSFHALFTARFSEPVTPLACGPVRATAENFTSQSLLFAGGSADHSQLLFQTPAALVPGTVAMPESGEALEGNNLYLSHGSDLSVINVLPEGPNPEAVFGAPSGEYRIPANFDHVISADGSRVYWTDLETHQVYLRRNPSQPQSPILAGQCTVPMDACTVPVSTGPAQYWTASVDGRFAYYTEAGALWRFDAIDGSRQALVSEGISGEPAEVQGVIGASEEGSFLYFVAGAALSGQPNFQGEIAESRSCVEAGGEEERGHLPDGVGCNLYVLPRGGAPIYVAPLAAFDNRMVRGGSATRVGDWRPTLSARTAAVTGDGRHLVFESTQQLTGYDNSLLTDPSTGGKRQRGVEVFVYSTASSGPGSLFCASCHPGGVPPVGEVISGVSEKGGTYVPVSMNPTFMQRWASADGSRVFFDTSQPLVSQDTNGAQDVYEWERESVGSCELQQPPRREGGCVFLLSGGNSSGYSYFLDADEAGANVFFTHRGPLADIGPTIPVNVVYDARVGGGFPEPSDSCSGSSCAASSVSPAPFTAPASPSFEGPGNQKPAKKKKHVRHERNKGMHKHRAKHDRKGSVRP